MNIAPQRARTSEVRRVCQVQLRTGCICYGSGFVRVQWVHGDGSNKMLYCTMNTIRGRVGLNEQLIPNFFPSFPKMLSLLTQFKVVSFFFFGGGGGKRLRSPLRTPRLILLHSCGTEAASCYIMMPLSTTPCKLVSLPFYYEITPRRLPSPSRITHSKLVLACLEVEQHNPENTFYFINLLG